MFKTKLMGFFTLTLLSLSAFAGEFKDHCTYSLSEGRLFQTQCLISTTYQGKSYCFGTEEGKDKFLENPVAMIAIAKAFYEKQPVASGKPLSSGNEDENGRTKISQADALAQIKSKTCDLSNKDAAYLEFDGMDLSHCKMVNTSFFGAYLRGAHLNNANLTGAYLNLARLENADFSGANLTDATIFQAIFDKTNFKGANLNNARMIGTLVGLDMSEASILKGRYGLDIGNQPMGAMRFEAVGGKFKNSNFEGADINRANVQFSDLRNANLRNTNLFRADLSKADLTGADITGANLEEAILDGTIMTGVKGLASIKGYAVEKGSCTDCQVSTK